MIPFEVDIDLRVKGEAYPVDKDWYFRPVVHARGKELEFHSADELWNYLEELGKDEGRATLSDPKGDC